MSKDKASVLIGRANIIIMKITNYCTIGAQPYEKMPNYGPWIPIIPNSQDENNNLDKRWEDDE